MTGAQQIRGRNWAIFNYAVDAVSAFGITIPRLRKLAHEIGEDHALAQRLWSDNSRETRILATMVDDPNQVTEEQMEKWTSDFFYWEICDQCCANLLADTEFAYEKCLEWSARDEEYVKRAAFILMTRLALKKSKISDEELERFLPIIRREAHDKRRFVKSAVAGTLHRIGKRSPNLSIKAMKTAQEIKELHSSSAIWLGTRALKKLKGDAAQKGRS